MTNRAGLEGEGARYALLRRLAPAMRHHLVVNLQPIGMIYDVMERRLQSPAPNLAQLKESASKINGFSRAAVRSCLDVMTWLSPEEGATSTLAEGADECVGLLCSNFNFRGLTLASEVAPDAATVSRAAIRNTLAASLLACTDARTSPVDVLLGGEVADAAAMLSIRLAPAADRESFSRDDGYRQITWADVAAIAREESVEVSHTDSLVTLIFPRVTAAVPLTVD